MGKFTDDAPLRAEDSVQPPSAQLLIRKLKVEKAAVDVQSKALADQERSRPKPRVQLTPTRLWRVTKEAG
jgi:hypothetical protein